MEELCFLALFLALICLSKGLIENDVEKFISESEPELELSKNKAVELRWAFLTNITEQTEAKYNAYQKVFDALSFKVGMKARDFDLHKINNVDLKRKLKMLSNVGPAALTKEKQERYNQIRSQMQKIYSSAQVPDYHNQTIMYKFNPNLKEKFKSSRDPEELKYYWDQWRNATGPQMRHLYHEYLDLSNEFAHLNGFQDATELKVEHYESDDFVTEMENIWNSLKPFYDELHAYTRHKLLHYYGEDLVPRDGPIPAHLFGNMWAQNWINIKDILIPFPEKPNLDVTDGMIKKGWTPKIMAEKADELYQSLGFPPMTESFWQNSIFERPSDSRKMVCHAQAIDFYNGRDFRIKMCAKASFQDLLIVVHEMGHTHHQRSYSHQSYLFSSSPNFGVSEGIADILSIAASSSSYIQRLGLLSPDQAVDPEMELNVLFSTALHKLAFLPFGYLVDRYRWDLYSGAVDQKHMNCHWVKLRLAIQGVSPANQRSEADFDASSKFHVAADIPYVRYFTARILQYQFYKAMCEAAGLYSPEDPERPLHRCDLYGKKEAGRLLISMMEMGASKPWREVIQVMTGQPKMDTAALREYFKPLEDWLKKYNRENNVPVGWNHHEHDLKKYCS